MAVSPMFFATMDDLRAEIRMSGLQDGEEGAILVDRAVSDVRVFFRDRLGGTRLTELLALYAVNDAFDDPGTDDEFTVARARSAEIVAVRVLLLDSMGSRFVDASANSIDQVLDEGVLRDAAIEDRREVQNALRARLNQLMDRLEGDLVEGDNVGFRAEALGPAETPPCPGYTVWGAPSPWS